jgi:hypothetical protein
MPLVKGKAAKSRKGFSENVKREMEALFSKTMTNMFKVL